LKRKWGASINRNMDAQLDNQPPYEYFRPTTAMWGSVGSDSEYRLFLQSRVLHGV